MKFGEDKKNPAALSSAGPNNLSQVLGPLASLIGDRRHQFLRATRSVQSRLVHLS